MRIKFNTYDVNTSGTNRYSLGNIRKKPLIVFGVNPSTANQYVSDNTITKIKQFAKLNSFDSYVVFNLYPKRATNPENLPDKISKVDCKKNIDVIIDILENVQKPVIWAAWGNTILMREYLITCLQDIHNQTAQFNPTWIVCGELTNLGHPRHPSRLGYKNSFSPFNIDSYLTNIEVKEIS